MSEVESVLQKQLLQSIIHTWFSLTLLKTNQVILDSIFYYSSNHVEIKVVDGELLPLVIRCVAELLNSLLYGSCEI